MDTVAFRAMFPALADYSVYSNDMLLLWWDAAALHLSEGWMLSGATYELARKLLTAHLVHLAHGIASSGSAGTSGGAVQSASEGSVSVSFTTPPTRSGWQFWLSSSPYGLQLWALLSAASAGGLYIGGLPEREAFRKVGGVFV